MTTTKTDQAFRVAFFNNVAAADLALRRLLAADFTKAELAVICPKQFEDQFTQDVPKAERPGSHAVQGIVEGGAVGAVLGGLSLAAVAIATGGVGLLPAVGVLVGGGALAGGYSGLIISDGYGKEIGRYYEEAIRLGEIVIGVAIDGEDSDKRLDSAEQIMAESGGKSPAEMSE
jgi:hypothetical protein